MVEPDDPAIFAYTRAVRIFVPYRLFCVLVRSVALRSLNAMTNASTT